MIYFMLAILAFSGCSMNSFVRTGYAPYCLVDYEFKLVDCSYPTMDSCRKQYSVNKQSVCFPSQDIKLRSPK